MLEGYTCRFNGDQSQSVDEVIRFLQLFLTNIASPMERLNELHEKYGISKTREAEDMCNYSQFLIEKGKKEGKEEGRENEKLDCLERMVNHHYTDIQIMELLGVNSEYLKYLRHKLLERQSTVLAD